MPNANAANILTGYEKGWYDATDGDLLTARELADKTGINFLDVLDWRYLARGSIVSGIEGSTELADEIRSLI